MGDYIALERLLWGEGYIEPGDPVPSDEPGRNYALAEQLGQIRPAVDGEVENAPAGQPRQRRARRKETP